MSTKKKLPGQKTTKVRSQSKKRAVARGQTARTTDRPAQSRAFREPGLLKRLAAGAVICAEGYLFELERRGYLPGGRLRAHRPRRAPRSC